MNGQKWVKDPQKTEYKVMPKSQLGNVLFRDRINRNK